MEENKKEKEIFVTDWISRAIRRYKKIGDNEEAKDGEKVLEIIEEKIKGMKILE